MSGNKLETMLHSVQPHVVSATAHATSHLRRFASADTKYGLPSSQPTVMTRTQVVIVGQTSSIVNRLVQAGMPSVHSETHVTKPISSP